MTTKLKAQQSLAKEEVIYENSIFQSWPTSKRFRILEDLVNNKDLSKDPRTRVSALLLSKPGQVVASGINHSPTINDGRPMPMRAANNSVPNYVVHAEEDAICSLATKQIRIRPVVAAISKVPCVHCISMLHRIGIQEIVWFGGQRDCSGQELARYLGIRWVPQELPKELVK